MFRKMSSKSLAEIFFVMLLLITVLYYIFPNNDSFFMLFSKLVGITFYSLMLFAIISICVSIIRLPLKYCKM
ncbi:hypothetical protein DKM28_06250 [Methanosarcina mazei]|uniref:Uncharacterized protein n=1 Tax=Methanosarcina mazei TaxID=2209 RepID=A0A4P8R4A4_METMZ|nr:hypothetical protein DKM28_06250 [Methanosarcina mazei]